MKVHNSGGGHSPLGNNCGSDCFRTRSYTVGASFHCSSVNKGGSDSATTGAGASDRGTVPPTAGRAEAKARRRSVLRASMAGAGLPDSPSLYQTRFGENKESVERGAILILRKEGVYWRGLSYSVPMPRASRPRPQIPRASRPRPQIPRASRPRPDKFPNDKMRIAIAHGVIRQFRRGVIRRRRRSSLRAGGGLRRVGR